MTNDKTFLKKFFEVHPRVLIRRRQTRQKKRGSCKAVCVTRKHNCQYIRWSVGSNRQKKEKRFESISLLRVSLNLFRFVLDLLFVDLTNDDS